MRFAPKKSFILILFSSIAALLIFNSAGSKDAAINEATEHYFQLHLDSLTQHIIRFERMAKSEHSK